MTALGTAKLSSDSWRQPVVCAWHPTAKRVLLWNLLPETRRVTVSYRGHQRVAELGPLGSVVLDGFPG